MKRILALLGTVLLDVLLVNSALVGYYQECPILLGLLSQQSEMPSPIVSSLPSVPFIVPQRPGMLLPPSNYVPVTPDLLHYTTNQLVHYFLKHNYSAQDILSQRLLYLNPDFVALVKPFVGYEEAITDLYNEFNVTDWRKSVHWLIKLGKIIDGRYKPKLHSTIIGLYHEIQKSHKQLIQKTYKDQHYVLADEVSEWRGLYSIITNGVGDATHLIARQKAYNDTVHDDLFYDRQYTLPDQVMRLLNDQGGDIKDYTECYGNQLQQVLHQECIDLVERVAMLPTHSGMYTHRCALFDTIDSARIHNQDGLVAKASIIADFCWSLLDCGQALVEGALEGLAYVASDAYHHPCENIMMAVAGLRYWHINCVRCWLMLRILVSLPSAILMLRMNNGMIILPP